MLQKAPQDEALLLKRALKPQTPGILLGHPCQT
jgi:hypothetical protein